MVFLMWVFLLLLLVQGKAPQNPHLARSVWPVAHHDSYSQGSTNVDTITKEDVLKGRAEVDYIFERGVSGTLSVFWDESGMAWGSSIYGIFKIDTGAPKLRILDVVRKPADLVHNDTFRGLYSVVASDGTFYTSLGNSILAVTSSPTNATRIQPLGAFVLDQFVRPGESLISLNMLYSGELAFCTTKGLVGIVSRDLRHLIAINSITHYDSLMTDGVTDNDGAAPLEVSNAMTIDENGGIYVVSSKYLHKLKYSNSTLTASWPTTDGNSMIMESKNLVARHSMLNDTWTVKYQTVPGLLPNRLSSQGSGSSPTIMTYGDRKFVVITDGLYRQNLNVFDADTGQLVASAPVDFGVPRSRNESYTEQSVLVHGNEMVVVQNALTPTGKRLNHMLSIWNAAAMLKNASERLTKHIHLTPVVLGDSSRGVQKFALVHNGTWSLQSVWSTLDFGCPNSIPTMSTHTKLIYCVSKGVRGRLANEVTRIREKAPRLVKDLIIPPTKYPDGFDGVWTIAGIDWHTGEKVFDLKTGGDIRFNSLYAAVQVGPRGEIIYGSMGGLVRARAAKKRVTLGLPR